MSNSRRRTAEQVQGDGAPQRRRAPRIEDVARLAGVSAATVDRVLNGRLGVRAITVQRVLKAAGELGYVTDGSAAAERPQAAASRVSAAGRLEPFHRLAGSADRQRAGSIRLCEHEGACRVHRELQARAAGAAASGLGPRCRRHRLHGSGASDGAGGGRLAGWAGRAGGDPDFGHRQHAAGCLCRSRQPLGRPNGRVSDLTLRRPAGPPRSP